MSRGSGIAAGYAVLALLALALALAPRRAEPAVDPGGRLARAIAGSADPRVAACVSTDGAPASPARARLVRSVAGAVVAVESHHRPRYVRMLKLVLADLQFTLTGTLPEVSLGPGQMKPRTAARVLADTGEGAAVSAAEIRRRLGDDCEAARLVRRYFDAALADVDVPDGVAPLGDARVRRRVLDAVQRYNGQSSRRQCAGEACDVYAGLVLRLAERGAVKAN